MKRHRTFVVLFGLLAAALAAVVGTALVRRAADARRLAAVVAELDRTDPGWRLDDLERARPDVPAAENFANALAAAAALVAPLPDVLALRLDAIEAGGPPNARHTPNQEADLRDAVARNVAAVAATLALADYPRGRHALAYAPDVVSTPRPHDAAVAALNGRLLDPLARLAASGGDVPRAVRVLRARLNCGRSYRDEPLLHSQLCRQWARWKAVRDLERLLGHATPDAGALAELRREFAAELAEDAWPLAVRAHRAAVHQAFEALRSGAVPMSALNGSTPRRYRPTAADRTGDWFHDRVVAATDSAHAVALERLTRVVVAASRPWPERLSAVAAVDAEWASAPDAALWLVRYDLTRMLRWLVEDQARLRCAAAALAAEEYRRTHGDWPASPAAAGPWPDDPFTGTPLLVRRVADGVVIYSVGANTIDDGGRPGDYAEPPDSADIVFRLWDVPQRNRPVGGTP